MPMKKPVNRPIRICLAATLLAAGLLRAGAVSASDSRSWDHRFTVPQLQEDFRQARKEMETLHPALYEFTDKETFDRLFDAQVRRIEQPMTVLEFYRVLAPLVVQIGCGHSRLVTPDGFWDGTPKRMLPLGLTFLKGKAVVTRVYAEEDSVPRGSEITAVNGLPMSDIVTTLKSFTPADGFNDSGRSATLGATFADMYALLYGFPEEFVLSYRAPGRDGEERRVLPPVDRRTIPESRDEREKPTSSGDPNLDFEIVKERDTAVLTIQSLNYYPDADRRRFDSFIDQAFREIDQASIGNLILDLRGNAGGNPFCTSHLLSYLESRPVPYFARQYGHGYESLSEPIPRATPPYAGKLFTLIDGGGFSSTGHLCALLKYHRIGTFIGMETGGTYECNDAARDVCLDNTRLRLRLARETFTVAVEGMSRRTGVLPDHPVEPGIQDLLNGSDPVKEAAFRLIQESRSR